MKNISAILSSEIDEQLFETIIGQVDDFVAIIDSEGQKLYYNSSYRRICGDGVFSDEADFFQDIHGEDREKVRLAVHTVKQSGQPHGVTYRLAIADGNIRHLESRLSVLRPGHGHPANLLVISHDITEQIEAEYKQSLLAYALSCTRDCFCLTDLENTILFVNPAFCETYGYAEEELVGKNIDIVRSPANSREIIDAIIPGTMNGRWNGEVQNRKKDGTDFPVELWTSVVRNDAGEPIALVGVARDISERRKTEEILQQSENKFRSLIENSADGIALLGQDGFPKYVSASTVRLLGYAIEELMNTPFMQYLHPDDVAHVTADFEDLLSHPGKVLFEQARVRHKDGSWRWVESTSKNLLHDPMVNAIVSNFRDITERRKAEGEKQSNLALFHSLIENMQSGILVETDDRRIFVTNKAFCDIFQVDAPGESLIGMNCVEAVERSKQLLTNPDEFAQRIDDLIRERTIVLGEEIEFKNRRVYERNYVPIYSASNEFVGHLWQYRDVTEGRQAEHIQSAVYRIAQAADQASTLEVLYRSVHDIIASIMPASNFYIALYDEKEDTISFTYFVDEVDPPMPPKKRGKGVTEYVLRTGRPLLCSMRLHEELERRGELELIGSPSPIWLGVPLIVEKKTIGVMAVQHYSDESAYGIAEQDMLEFVSSQIANAINRKRVEDALRKSEERYRAFVEQSSEGIWRYEFGEPIPITLPEDEQIRSMFKLGYLAECNDAMAHMFGYSKASDIIGTRVGDLLMEADAKNLEFLRAFIHSGYRITEAESHEIGKDGKTKNFLNNLVGILEDGCLKQAWGTRRDITEHKRAAELLMISEEKYRTLFEESQDGIFLSTPDGFLIDVNPAGVELFGYPSKEELLRADIARDLYFNSEDREIYKFNLARQGFVLDFEFTIKRKDGEKRIVQESASAVRNDQGNIVAYRGFIRDITERKKLEDQLRQVQKMEGIGTLAGGIAHDFNNLLGTILGYTTLIEGSTLDQQKLKQSIDTIKKAVERGASLVRQLLTFARKADPAFESVNINETVTELVKMLQQTFPKTINIVSDIYGGMPPVVADATQLHQALLNLCVNARDAMMESHVPAGVGTLTLGTGIVAGSSLRQKYGNAGADEYAFVKVKDTGAGMDEATRQRIFEPFFTTKELGKGTGLGLAVVYGIVNSHHGFIDVESEKERGTAFTLYFPVQSRKIIETHPVVEETKEAKGGNETILLVEDEEMLRELLKNLIEDQGYCVLQAADGQEGFEIYQSKKDQIAVVLSDMGLPRLGGWEMFQKMRELNPKIRAILASGYFDPTLKMDMLKAGAKDFIQKPYVSEEILRRIREVIDKGS